MRNTLLAEHTQETGNSKPEIKLLMNAAEVAERYSVSESQIYKWARSGIIPSIRLSPRCLRFSPHSLDNHFLALEVEAAAVRPAERWCEN